MEVRILILLLLVFNSYAYAQNKYHLEEIVSSSTEVYGWPGYPLKVIDNSYKPKVVHSEKNVLKTNASKLGIKLKNIIDKLPDGTLKDGLTKYVEIISLESYTNDSLVRNSNKGIVAYMEKVFTKGDCFQALTKDFYKEISIMDNISTPIDGNRQNLLFRNASLDTEAGSGDYTDLPKGWLWKIAQRYSDNNSNLAIALIGVCGHDDSSQGEYVWLDDSAEARAKIEEAIKDSDRQIKGLRHIIETKGEANIESYSNELQSLLEYKAELKKQTSVEEKMMCPFSNSKMYIPKSLGQDVDIAESLKDKIAKIQAPTMGAAALPAKYYHIYGAAFMGCQLIQEGVDPTTTVLLQKNAARFYRGLRMCDATSTYNTQHKTLIKFYNEYKEHYESKIKKKETRRGVRVKRAKPLNPEQFFIRKSIDLVQSKSCTQPPDPTFADSNDKDYNQIKKNYEIWSNEYSDICNFISNKIGIPHYDKDLDVEIVESKVKIYVEKLNAAYLYQKWYVGGEEVFGMKLPCTDYRLFGPSSLTDNKKTTRRRLAKRCVSGYSVEACKRAKKRLATWDMDFKWTIAQHEVGAKFAVKECTKNKEKKSINTLACEVIDSRKSSSSSFKKGIH